MSPPCPEAQHLLAYATGRLAAEARDEIDRHLPGCTSCRQAVDAAQDELAQARTRQVVSLPGLGTVPPAPPQRVGRYLVLEVLGVGGMGEVLLAYDPALDRRVAIKLARRHAGDDTELLEDRLRREAQSLARVVHPNVVAVFDTGNADGRPFVAMEYVPGTTLKGWLKTRPSRQEVLRMFLGAARGLAAAHRVGVVHRDFKPDNVLVDNKGHARVTDFGLATLLESSSAQGADLSDEDTQRVTASDQGVMGTPGYMPPEQWLGQTTDARSDQFSFFVALHEGLVGQRPFSRSSPGRKRPDFVAGPALQKKLKDLPPRLRKLLERGLSIEPADRYASMEPVIVELERTLRPLPVRWAALGVATALAASVWTVFALRSPCHGALERIRAVRPAVPFATAAPGDREVAAAERFEAAWAAAWTDACRETRERGEQPPEVLALRNECLARQSRRYHLVLQQLSSPRSDVRASALEALEASPMPDECLAVEALLAVDRPPASQRAELEALEERLLEARVLIDVGRYEDAQSALKQLDAPVHATGFRPAAAAYAYLRGYLALREQRWRDARPLLNDAVSDAIAARDFELAARAASDAVFVSGYALGFHDEAQVLTNIAHGLLARLDNRDLEARLENSQGLAAMGQGQLGEARTHLERAYALRLGRLGAAHLETSKVAGNLGLLALRQGRLDDAVALLRDDLRVREQVLGPHHPLVALSLVNLASATGESGAHEEAVVLLKRALDIRQAVFGSTHALVLATRADFALALAIAGRFDDARAIQMDALAKAKLEHGEDSVEVADALSTLASTEEEAKAPARALEYSQAALGLYRKRLAAQDDAVFNEREREADLLVTLGRFAEAQARLEALIQEYRADPQRQAGLAAALAMSGRALVLQKRAAPAVAALDEALRLASALEVSPAQRGHIGFLLAQAEQLTGQGVAARQRAQAARALLEEARDTEKVQQLDAWMSTLR